MKKKVLLITKSVFLDATLEYIQNVKKHVSLNVLIEVDPFSKASTILRLKELPNKTFVLPHEILDEGELSKFNFYSAGCISFLFFVHNRKRSFSLSSIRKSYLFTKYIKSISPDVIHFDDVSLRLITAILFINNRMLILNVHDPKMHIGEHDWKKVLGRRVFYRKAVKFITFSDYSKRVFLEINGQDKECIHLKLQPYKFYISNSTTYRKENIAFVGRISPYKGIELFANAIKLVWERYPDQKFTVAGTPIKGYNVEWLKKIRPTHLKVVSKYLDYREVTDIIQNSKVVVCPYIEATQSGVVMTANALSTPVIATNVGGMSEYISHGVTGLIVNSTPESIACACIQVIEDPELSIRMSNIIRQEVNSSALPLKAIQEIYEF